MTVLKRYHAHPVNQYSVKTDRVSVKKTRVNLLTQQFSQILLLVCKTNLSYVTLMAKLAHRHKTCAQLFPHAHLDT